HNDEKQADGCNEDEIGQQVLEREDVTGDRLGDGDLLDAPHIADLPIMLRAFGVGIMAVHARLPHDQGAMRRTRSLNSEFDTSLKTWRGFSRRRCSASVSNASSVCGARLANGKSDTNR